jgi:60S ribosome subunit biogenesis protein NIP7
VPILAEHARYKIWVKENGAQPFLYGSNGTSLFSLPMLPHTLTTLPVAKAHVGRWSDDCPEHSGCVVLSMADIPLGFGVTARSTAEARRLDPTGIVCFRQSDCGEYLRDEDTLFAG